MRLPHVAPHVLLLCILLPLQMVPHLAGAGKDRTARTMPLTPSKAPTSLVSIIDSCIWATAQYCVLD